MKISTILLMVQKSGGHQLICSLSHLSHYLRGVSYMSGGFLAEVLNHQQYSLIVQDYLRSTTVSASLNRW